jgi:hypothetical protein
MGSRWQNQAAKMAIRLGFIRAIIFSLKDWLIMRSWGSIIDYSFLAEVRVNQSMEHHLRDGQSGDCEFRLILESKQTGSLTLHFQTSSLTAGRELDTHLK